jgi:peptidoglycan/LPS O-acetylase OafA/YrhL
MSAVDKRNWGLDLMRALAIFGVFYGHFREHMRPDTIWPKTLIVPGLMGVELFYVLSGFLIGGILVREFDKGRLHHISGLFRFYTRRWFRTLPLFFFYWGLFWIIQLPHSAFHTGEIWKTAFFVKYLFGAKTDQFMGVSWSLAIEEWFYLLLPLLIFSLKKSGRSAVPLSAAIMIVFAICWRFVVMPTAHDWPAFEIYVRKATFGRLDSLMYGVFMAWLVSAKPEIWAGLVKWSVLLIVPIALFHYVSFDTQLLTPMLYGVGQKFYFSLYSLFCALLLPFFFSVKRPAITGSAIPSFLADISYSLYLCHILAVMLVNHLLHVDFFNPATKHDYYMFLYTAVACTFAYITRVTVEKPSLWVRQRLVP